MSNRQGMLKQDLFAELSLVVGESHRSVTIPVEALISAEGEDFVFVEEGGVFVRRDLVLGARDDRYVEVKKGLEAGERVVTDGKRQLYTKSLMSRRGGAPLGGHGH
jgi:multidrug efflux pump subunit AcrA (membrane-fusion protein)